MPPRIASRSSSLSGGHAVDLGERVVVAHVEGVVGAHHHVVGAHLLHQELQVRGVEDQAVDVDLLEVGARRARDVVPALGPQVVGVVHPRGVERQVAAAVHGHELDVGVVLQHAAVDDPGQRDRGVERVADHVGEVVLPEPLAAGEAVGVEHHDNVELLGLGPERPEAPVVEVHAHDVGVDLDAAEVVLLHAPLELLDGRAHVLHRHRRQADEPVGVVGDDLGEVLVLHPGQLTAELRVGPVEVARRGDRDRLHVDPHRVHVGKPDVHVRRLRHDLLDVAHLVGVGLLAAEVAERLHLGRHQPLDQGQAVREDDVGVDVDRAAGVAGHGHLLVSCVVGVVTGRLSRPPGRRSPTAAGRRRTSRRGRRPSGRVPRTARPGPRGRRARRGVRWRRGR